MVSYGKPSIRRPIAVVGFCALSGQMSQSSNTLQQIEEIADFGITLSDGCRLSARVWKPVESEPVPAILEFLPYRKRDGTTARDALTHPYFAKRGYACFRVDMRGNGDSEGVMEDEYTPQELSDALEVVNFLAAQDWCNGSVGMMGISWGGFNSLQVAALQPEPLKAIITLCSTVDRYADDIHYKGGCLLNENLGWGSTMWSYSSRAPDPALVGSKWRDMWLERLEEEPFLPSVWLRHQRRDAYWQHGSVCEGFPQIKAATLAVGGWGDAYKNAVPALVQNLEAPVKGIVGPWIHKYPHFAVPEPRIGFLQEALRWWDRWLKGIENGAEDDPDYRVYLMDGARPKAWYLERSGIWITSGNHLAEPSLEILKVNASGLGAKPGAIEDIIASPQHCGMAGGEYCAIWLGPELPGDQRVDDALSAVYKTEPLRADKDIVGAPVVRLWLASDKPQAQIAVRLLHILPDGSSTRITYGVLNLSHRDGHAEPAAMPVGEALEVAVTLDHIAYRVPKGHRIAIAISNSYWPLLWPAPEAATLTLTGTDVELPIRATATQNECTFLPPEADTPWQTETIREASNTRRVETDMGSGVVTLVIKDDFGKVRDCDHGLVNGSVAREWWSIHPDDPLSARGRTHWTDEIERDELKLRTEAFSEMWSDKTTFYLRARLEAYENDQLVFEKDIEDQVARDYI